MHFPLIDTHCHVDLLPNPEDVAKESLIRKTHIIAVTNAPSAFGRMKSLEKGNPYFHAALGMHPQLISAISQEFSLFEELLKETIFIGEIGLDNTAKDIVSFEKQKAIFVKILRVCANAGGKILTVHSRNAANDVIEMIGDHFPGKIILHWFSGSKTNFKKAIDYGMYFSVNEAMLRSKKGKDFIFSVPKERVLTETDAPFISKDSPFYQIETTTKILANLWEIGTDEAGKILKSNYESLFQQNGVVSLF